MISPSVQAIVTLERFALAYLIVLVVLVVPVVQSIAFRLVLSLSS